MSVNDRRIDRLFEKLASTGDRYFRSIFYLLVLAYVIAMLVEATRYGPDARLFPLLVGVPLTVLLTSKVVLDLSKRLDTDVAGPLDGVFEEIRVRERNDEGDEERRYRREAEMLLWLAVLLVSIRVLGFFLAALVYVTGFVYHQEGTLKRALLTSAVTTAFLYLLFVVILSAPVYGGILP